MESSLQDEGLTIRPDAAERPVLFPEHPATDRLLAMIAALASELAVLRARLDTHERLAGAAGVFDRDAVEGYVPDEGTAAERRRETQALIGRVFDVLRRETQALADDGSVQRRLAERVTGAGEKP